MSFKNHKNWIIFLLTVVGLEIAAMVLSPYRNYPSADTWHRNPITQRGWPEFTDVPPKGDSKRAVFIGNSQAVGYEMRNPDSTYFGILRRTFKSSYPDWEIQNWSTGGVRMAEMQILTARAIERKADKIVFLIQADNFDTPENIRLGFIDSDVKLLLANKSVRKIASQLEIGKHISGREIYTLWLEKNISLLRCRQYILDQSTIYTEEHNDVFWYGNNINDGQVIDFERFPDEYEKYMEHWHRKERLNVKMGDLDSAYAQIRLREFLHFEEQLHSLSQQYGFEYEFIWTPYYTPAYSASSRMLVDSLFIQPSIDASENALDLTYAVDSSGFLSRAHFNSRGHRLFADRLLKHWRDDF